MSYDLPEYYQHLVNQEGEDDALSATDEVTGEEAEAKAKEPCPFRAHAFRLMLPSQEWTDRSLYTLTGPTSDGIQHNITIQQEAEVEALSLEDFQEEQVASLEESLAGCQVLLQDTVTLDCGLPAGRAIYFWYPKEDLKLYQEQLYVLVDDVGYTLTSSFTRKTRKKLGPSVERMMLSFTPRGAASPLS